MRVPKSSAPEYHENSAHNRQYSAKVIQNRKWTEQSANCQKEKAILGATDGRHLLVIPHLLVRWGDLGIVRRWDRLSIGARVRGRLTKSFAGPQGWCKGKSEIGRASCRERV